MAKKENLSKNQGWLDLCEWVEINIFDYDVPNQRLQKPACLILMGLTKGQNVANNNLQTYGDYPYEIILMTFKAHKTRIKNAILGKNFGDKDVEKKKMSYVCAIVRKEINDIYSRYLSAQKAQAKIENIDMDIVMHEGAEFLFKNFLINSFFFYFICRLFLICILFL